LNKELQYQVGWKTCRTLVLEAWILTPLTVDAGEDVTLLCNNLRLNVVFFFWMKSVPGKMPEIVGKRFSKSDEFNNTGHFTTKEEDGRFFLKISKAKPSDIAFYYCFTLKNYKITFMKAVKTILKKNVLDLFHFSVDPVTAGDVVALQCSVLSEFQNDACPEEHRVFWFRKTEGESHPTYIYARRSSDGDCDGGTETQPLQNCVYSFLKNVSSSDAGLYYCAVAACGKVVFGNGTELDVEAVKEKKHTHNCTEKKIKFKFKFILFIKHLSCQTDSSSTSKREMTEL
uniref:Ig-like domain-containing protein n=1 Tax=Oryzias latipes TaxID=8090 RepID=A0A3P9JG06_ORYLA